MLLFATLAPTALLPLQLLDHSWQVLFFRTLLDNASLPWLALALQQIGRCPPLPAKMTPLHADHIDYRGA